MYKDIFEVHEADYLEEMEAREFLNDWLAFEADMSTHPFDN